MKYVALILLIAASAGCAAPKKIMRGCKTLNLGYFECDNK